MLVSPRGDMYPSSHLVHLLPAQAAPKLFILLQVLGLAVSLTLCNRAEPHHGEPSLLPPGILPT